jgi:hypothetical protein
MRSLVACLFVAGAVLSVQGCGGGDDSGTNVIPLDDGSTGDSLGTGGSTGDGSDCNAQCKTSSGGSPTNACRVVAGQSVCVFICDKDSDCEAPYYTGCTGLAADGTKICALAASSDAGSDATDDGSEASNDATDETASDVSADVSTDVSADVSTDANDDESADVIEDHQFYPDGLPEVSYDVPDIPLDSGLAAACIASGGSVTAQYCCVSSTDFPNLCGVNACGCVLHSDAGSSLIHVCTCPTNQCFDGTSCRDESDAGDAGSE